MRTVIKTEAAGATLADLAPGDRAVIEGVRGDGPSSDRLRELGFAPGTEILFVRRAPLGDPCCFRLRGTELCLRRGEALQVDVKRLP